MQQVTKSSDSSNSSSGGVILKPPTGKGKSVNSSNSSNSSTFQPSPRIEHFFTWFNYNEDSLKEFLDFCEFKCKKYAFQEEECPKTGKIHLQGILCLHKKERDTSFGLPKDIHWEKVRDENRATRYCLKDYTRVGRQWSKGIRKPVQDPMEGLELYPWQKDILEIIQGPVHPRKIYWYWDPTGNAGKTSFAKHLCLKHNAIFLSGKGTDIFFAIAAALETKEIPIVIFGFPRALEEYVAYGALESVKDGMFFSGKYESAQCLFNPPHIIVLCNFAPDQSKLSADRWEVVNIENHQT